MQIFIKFEIMGYEYFLKSEGLENLIGEVYSRVSSKSWYSNEIRALYYEFRKTIKDNGLVSKYEEYKRSFKVPFEKRKNDQK